MAEEGPALSFSSVRRIFVARAPQDMRRGINSLSCMVEHELGHEPYTGDCFIFLSRDRKKLKVLIWEDGGFWLCMKRLITGTFAAVSSWSSSSEPSVAVTPARIHALIEGIDMKNTHFRARTRADGLQNTDTQLFIKCGVSTMILPNGLDGQPLVQVDFKTVIKLDFLAGRFVARHIITPFYGVPWSSESERLHAQVPACIVPQGKATDELILHLLRAKYGCHQPLYRLEESAREAGVELPRSTIMDWIRRATDLLAPVAEAIKSETLIATIIHTDETPVKQLPKRDTDPTLGRDSGNGKRKRPGKCTTARFWVYRSATTAWYHYTENRQGIHPQTILANYTGFVVADAYAGFDKVFLKGTAIEIACWAHTRRKFFEALHPPQRDNDTDAEKSSSTAVITGDPRAEQALALIRQLYQIEREITTSPSAERRTQRQQRSKPILATLKIKLDAWKIACRPTEPLGKAVTYALNQWLALSRFVDNDVAPIDVQSQNSDRFQSQNSGRVQSDRP